MVRRSSIGELIKAKKNFKLRLPSAGATVKTDYSRSIHTLQVGDLVGAMAPTSTWLDIGEIVKILSRDASGMQRVTLVLVPRVDELTSFQKFTMPVSHVVCVLSPCND